MIKVIPFEPEHIMGIKPLINDATMLQLVNDSAYLKLLKQLGPAYSGFTPEGQCVGAAGIKQVTGTTVEGWAVLAEDSKKYSKSIIRAIDLFIQNYFKHNAADRFQATVKMNFTKGHRLARILKFKPEGILHSYEYGEDYMMYGRINSWL